MNQVMFLPHQILGCLFAAGKMDMIAGTEVTCFELLMKHQLNVQPNLTSKEIEQFPAIAPKALSSYWKDLAHTSWFKEHPVLSAASFKFSKADSPSMKQNFNYQRSEICF